MIIVCNECGKSFEAESLRMWYCVTCGENRRERFAREYYRQNKEHIRERQRLYYAKKINKDKKKTWNKKYYLENRDKALAYQREYHKKKKEL